MIPSAIQNAIGQHLSAGIARPIVWPSRTTTPTRPYLVMQGEDQGDLSTNTRDDEKRHAEGREMVVVVADLNGLATLAVDLAAAVRARFPKDLCLAGVTIARAQVLPGYRTDTDWRIPVEVSWIAADMPSSGCPRP